MTQTDKEKARYQARMAKKKAHIDQKVAEATEERGIIIILTGNGKGKSTAGFGNVARCVGHGFKAGVIQFIKGTWACGERDLLEQHGVEFHVMATGFTWDTQDKEKDTAAAQAVWQSGKTMLTNPELRLVLLDELTYMIRYSYLDENEVITTLQNRPKQQSVIITGRGCPKALIELADTVSEIKPVKHAFDVGIKAQQGIDW
ncbi:cob(I)yrinic acid a,c-diamide adenosyltransferase [Spartinivicinus poritis]|uniref:Corrinoid adenosyltransferase n=1 Tax=Spartinivicinus poritis TaxID=2994640 RepID=A0ABT5UEV4_9GAMM|nr:cob(I)yrinic acid a,c-diamide adenosyltransferase [Spartinivicinus sp. A2-2]MDE1464901.1 cob(I)yrinic acid a,c-diamide adenosyltransferase [Spartinivicinus sp. A2-2]